MTGPSGGVRAQEQAAIVATCVLPTPRQIMARLLRVRGTGLIVLVWGLLLYESLPLLVRSNVEQLRWTIRVCLTAVPLLGGLFLMVLPWLWSRPLHRVLRDWEDGRPVSRAQCVAAYELALFLPWRTAVAAGAAVLIACLVGLSVVSWQAHLPLIEMAKTLPAIPLVGGMTGVFCYFGTVRTLYPVVTRCSAELRHARPVRRGSLGAKFLTMTCLLVISALCLLQPAAYTVVQVITERYMSDRALTQLRFAASDAKLGTHGYVFTMDETGRILTPHPRGYTHLSQERFDQPEPRFMGHEDAWTDHVGEHRVIAFRRMSEPPRTVVSVSFPTDFDLPLRTFVQFSWMVALGLAFVVFLCGRYYTRNITTPLAELTQAARQIAQRGDLSQHVPVTTNDEISEVARAFNQMVERLHSSKRDLEEHTRRLERSTQELSSLNQEMEDLLHVVSHDLRAPLINIQGFSKRLEPVMEATVQVLEQAAAHSQQNGLRRDVEALKGTIRNRFGESMQFISKSVEKMDALLSSLLAISRVGRKADPVLPNDLNTILDDVLATVEHQLTERSMQVIRHPLPTGVPCRRNEINQVFSNLLANAVTYMGEATPRVIEVGGTAYEDRVECFVRDSGIGIDPADHERIFQMFTRLEAIDVPGEGVGLAYVKKIVRSHGGQIWVESTRGRGSTFFFSLPTCLPPQGGRQARAVPTTTDTV